jgi:hypothetical protein
LDFAGLGVGHQCNRIDSLGEFAVFGDFDLYLSIVYFRMELQASFRRTYSVAIDDAGAERGDGFGGFDVFGQNAAG